MYQVKIYNGINDNVGTVIHSPFVDDLKLSSGTLTLKLNAADDFSFAVNLNNPAWGKIKPYQTLIDITDISRNRVIFSGRVIQPSGSMDDNGHFARKFESESIMAYLQDSSQRHAEIRDTTVREFLEIIIANHNSQVEPHKRFIVGNVTVTNTTDNVYRYLGYEKTFATIKDKLIDRLGGYLVIRRESDGNYIDYLEDVGDFVEDTPIRLAHNMKSMSYQIDPTQIITRLVPLGMSIESEEEGAADASQARLTISEVNNGLDYLDDLPLQAEFGIIEGSVTWDDVTTAQRLMTNGLNYLRDQKTSVTNYTVSAVNLDLIGLDINSFEVGNKHQLINPVLGIDEPIQVIEKKIDILVDTNSTLTIGDKYRTLTQYQSELRKSQKSAADLQKAVSRQSSKIGALNTDLENAKDELEQTKQQLQDFENITDEDLIAITSSINTILASVDQLEQLIQDIPGTELAGFETNGLMSSMDYAKLYGINWYVNASNPDFRIYDHNVYIYYAFQALDEEYSEGLEVGGGYYYLGRLLEKMARKIDEYETRLTILEGGA